MLTMNFLTYLFEHDFNHWFEKCKFDRISSLI